MPAITVQTTTGEVKVDPADIDSLTYRVGDKERTVEGPEVLKMFVAFMEARHKHQLLQDLREGQAKINAKHERSQDEIRRSNFGYR